MARHFMIATAVLAALVVLAAVAVPEGEVVTLTTVDADDQNCDTQLWIVELDGASYLRSGSPDSRWLARLRRRPDAVLTRESEAGTAQATPITASPSADSALRQRVNRAMAEKYGLADDLLGRVIDRSRSVPILLAPGTGPPAAQGSSH